MFRMRRYRLFLFIAILTTATVWHLTRIKVWDIPNLEGWRKTGLNNDSPDSKPGANALAQPDLPPAPAPAPLPAPEQPKAQPAQKSSTSVELAVQVTATSPLAALSSSTSAVQGSATTVTGEELLAQHPSDEDDFGQFGHGRLDVNPRPSGKPRAYWRPQKEHFPVASTDLKLLPTGKAQPLPKIQYAFKQESAIQRSARMQKQNAIKESFKHAWAGYKSNAFGHDELKPVTNTTANPFNGWGATLIDALDTLWIMDLKEEFAEALEMVKKIDFKTSARKDIPLFETTIRYLGGLISAYDLTSAKYPVLLDKAVELADVLMGAFDTPNRMPIPYYQWAPSYASQPHRSSTHIVLAELGSLAMEFTRLAQITKEMKYYDAIARITDALEEWQMKTTIPGVWPVRLDASGCLKADRATTELHSAESLHGPVSEALRSAQSAKDSFANPQFGSAGLIKRQGDDVAVGLDTKPAGVPVHHHGMLPAGVEKLAEDVVASNVECEAQGLSFEPYAYTHSYSIAAMADSVYEYFPKQHALLGGRTEQYKTMYTKSIKAIRDEFLFRPMTKDEADILFIAKHDMSPSKSDLTNRATAYEGTHLGCFVGGMFALGSKMFDIPGDLALARRLTDGCVWAYNSLPLGVMAEEFAMVPCDSLTTCAWNQTKWYQSLDPHQQQRFLAVEMYNKNQEEFYNQASSDGARDDAFHGGAGPQQTPPPVVSDPSAKHKRSPEPRNPPAVAALTNEDMPEAVEEEVEEEPEEEEETIVTGPATFIPAVALSHEKYVEARILEERLPPGYTQFRSRAYKLRPEAIESVFIMYRITGEESWREKGWKMFTAIERATKTPTAHAAIRDVTSQLLDLSDTMESFWLAETLKYFYLLFSEPDLVSLDDYVLNTEAHPFRLSK